MADFLSISSSSQQNKLILKYENKFTVDLSSESKLCASDSSDVVVASPDKDTGKVLHFFNQKGELKHSERIPFTSRWFQGEFDIGPHDTMAVIINNHLYFKGSNAVTWLCYDVFKQISAVNLRCVYFSTGGCMIVTCNGQNEVGEKTIFLCTVSPSGNLNSSVDFGLYGIKTCDHSDYKIDYKMQKTGNDDIIMHEANGQYIIAKDGHVSFIKEPYNSFGFDKAGNILFARLKSGKIEISVYTPKGELQAMLPLPEVQHDGFEAKGVVIKGMPDGKLAVLCNGYINGLNMHMVHIVFLYTLEFSK